MRHYPRLSPSGSLIELKTSPLQFANTDTEIIKSIPLIVFKSLVGRPSSKEVDNPVVLVGLLDAKRLDFRSSGGGDRSGRDRCLGGSDRLGRNSSRNLLISHVGLQSYVWDLGFIIRSATGHDSPTCGHEFNRPRRRAAGVDAGESGGGVGEEFSVVSSD